MLIRRRFLAGGLGGLAAVAGFQTGLAAGTKAHKTYEITRTADEWRKLLTPEQFQVLREHGTERAFSSPLDKHWVAGTYHCAGCDLALFSSKTKFDSKTGWPSFWEPVRDGKGASVGETEDRAFFMVRTEVHCRRCGGHQGHVFPDGPKPTGLRYCINGVALKFVPEKAAS